MRALPASTKPAIALPGGKVLIAGGFDTQTTITSSAELYDPSTGSFTATGSMTDSRAEDGSVSFSALGSPPSPARNRSNLR